jgi:hypothetical protein
MRLINYGCTNDEFETMLATQQGKCAICQSPELNRHKGGVRKLSIDHDHATGRIRALLCGACNTGLGSLRHDPTIFEAAIAYLEATSFIRHSATYAIGADVETSPRL